MLLPLNGPSKPVECSSFSPKFSPWARSFSSNSPTLRIREPLVNALRHDLADILSGLKILDRRGGKPIHCVKSLRKLPCGGCSDMQDSQTKEKPPKRLLLTGLDAL